MTASILRLLSVGLVFLYFPLSITAQSASSLKRISYQSEADQSEREFLLYLPKGFDDNPDKKWPVMLFLHGNGERGNGTTELDFVLTHGPLYEAWIQKRDLPFIIIGPQLQMFGMDKYANYLAERSADQMPKAFEDSIPPRSPKWTSDLPMDGQLSSTDYPFESYGPPMGWELVEADLMDMLDLVIDEYRGDQSRTYLTGLSYGGFGTWYLASKNPQRFAAISPVVGWGHVDLMTSIARHKIPIWCIAGGRDQAVILKYFYPGVNELERLGHEVRFTIEADMAHDTWKRVYGGNDLYDWFLTHHK